MNLIFCPLPFEQKALLAFFEQQSFQYIRSPDGHVSFPDLDLEIYCSGHGKTQTAIKTLQILRLAPKSQKVFLIGSAGSLQSQVQTLDVVLGQGSFEHDFKSSIPHLSMPTHSEQNLVVEKSIFKNLTNLNFQIHLGLIASGDEDILDPERARQILVSSNQKALAVAWEGSGFARACIESKKTWLEIRGITDLANSNTHQDFITNLNLAMANCGQIFLELLK